MKKLNLTGQRFGKLVVLNEGEPRIEPSGKKKVRWNCLCDCGNTALVSTDNLRSGHTTSCGCLVSRTNLTGQKFGRLTALELVKNKGWKCQCECGNIVYIEGYNLKNGNTQSCGCLQKDRTSQTTYKSLVGQRFGKLFVLKRIENNRYNHVQYLCQCDCGNTSIIDASNLREGNTNSCGCIKSLGEYKIKCWLKEHNINFIPQYSHDNIFLSSGRRPIFDFAIFNNNQLQYLIEYNGKQHYQATGGWNTNETYLETVKRDTEKQIECAKLNIPLYIIPYWDIDNLDAILMQIIAPDIEEAQELNEEGE